MKLRHFIKYLSSYVLAACLLCSITLPAKASTMRASDYFAGFYAYVDTGSNGDLSISFSVSSLGPMDKLGATTIYLYEDAGNGFRQVKKYSSSDWEYSYRMGSNTVAYGESVPYRGTVGNNYYAVVHFLAENRDGSDTTSFMTPVVTAK